MFTGSLPPSKSWTLIFILILQWDYKNHCYEFQISAQVYIFPRHSALEIGKFLEGRMVPTRFTFILLYLLKCCLLIYNVVSLALWDLHSVFWFLSSSYGPLPGKSPNCQSLSLKLGLIIALSNKIAAIVDSICIFLMTNGVENLFMLLSDIWYYSDLNFLSIWQALTSDFFFFLVKCLFREFAHFLNWVFLFVCLFPYNEFQNSLNILDPNLIANI